MTGNANCGGQSATTLQTPPAQTPVQSCVWDPSVGAGQRKFAHLGDLPLESGFSLPNVTLAYETWGELNANGTNAILICHALTGDSHVCGEASSAHPTPGWWEGIVGPGCALDTNKYYVVAPNILGGCQGSTGPASPDSNGKPWGSRFPLLTTRDQVSAEYALMKHLHIAKWHTIVGASLGGHRALEWAISYPTKMERLVTIATGAATTGEQAAWCHSQLHALELDPYFNNGDYYDNPEGCTPERGLALARMIAHTTYRSPAELQERFAGQPAVGEDPLIGGRWSVQSYLDHHGKKLTRRFDAGSYRALTRSMLTHDVGRGRGGVANALGRIRAQVLVLGVDSDRLFFPAQSEEIAKYTPRATLRIIHSEHGHDGFLIESDAVSKALREFFNTTTPARA